MDENEVLERFGKLVIKSSYDYVLNGILYGVLKADKVHHSEVKWKNFLHNINKEELALLEVELQDKLGLFIFEFLKIFEENQEFSLMFKNEEHNFDLKELSAFFSVEATREGGWIEKYSEFSKFQFQKD